MSKIPFNLLGIIERTALGTVDKENVKSTCMSLMVGNKVTTIDLHDEKNEQAVRVIESGICTLLKGMK